MYKCLFRSLFTAQNSAGGVYESCVLAAKRDSSSASIFRMCMQRIRSCLSRSDYGGNVFSRATQTSDMRITNRAGVKCLSISSAKLCEKSHGFAPSEQDEKKCNQTETKILAKPNSAGDDKSLKAADKQEEASVLMTDNGSSTQQHTDVVAEQNVAKKKEAEAAKSGKENLLDLLGAMKVDITSKRRPKHLKTKQEFTSKPKTAPMESTISMFQKATVPSSQSETLNPELFAAASAAASTLPNSSQAESELLQQLRQHEAITEAQRKGDNNIGQIITKMIVGKRLNRQNNRPSNQIQFDDDGRGYTVDRGVTGELDGVRKRRNLFIVKRLNIFSPSTDEDAVEPATARPTLWDVDFANQLLLQTNQMPRNGFEEMIQWTKQGKMWQYPISNEAGLEEEANVPFHEHIFLEKHVEDGFPRQGPVRHFMELVVAGLCRNPYLTVQQKKEHISWFRDYFRQKEDVLKEADVYLN